MKTDKLLQQINFIKEIDKIKYIERKTKLFNSDRNENDAEHSWHLAMMTIVLAEHSDVPIDVLKVLKMVLIHDIVEMMQAIHLYMTLRKTIRILTKKEQQQIEFSGCYPKNKLTN